MTVRHNRRWIFAQRPTARIEPSTFALQHSAIPEPKEGEALVRIAWLGIEPTQRNWLNANAGYTDSMQIGTVMKGAAAGQVVASRQPGLAAGTWVVGNLGWQDYAIVSTEGLHGITQVPPGIEPRLMLGLFGSSGLTAYFGMTDIARPESGDIVLVSGAAGAVGSLAGQIAAIQGARVIGIAGGEEKGRWLVNDLGFDAAIDHRAEAVSTRIHDLAPEGVNVFFDNVGGQILESALDNLALHARIVVCGGVSSGYTGIAAAQGPRNYMQLGFRRARMEGFIFFDYLARFPEAFGQLAEWYASGKLIYREQIADGLDQAPAALQGLFDGANIGKQVVRITDPADIEAH